MNTRCILSLCKAEVAHALRDRSSFERLRIRTMFVKIVGARDT